MPLSSAQKSPRNPKDMSLRKSLRSGEFNRKSESGDGWISGVTLKRQSMNPSPLPSPRDDAKSPTSMSQATTAEPDPESARRHFDKRLSISELVNVSLETADNGEILIEGLMEISKGKKFSERFVRLRELAIEYFGVEDEERTLPRGHVRLVDMGEITQYEDSFMLEVLERAIEFRPADKDSLDDWVSLLREAILSAKRPDEPMLTWPSDWPKPSPRAPEKQSAMELSASGGYPRPPQVDEAPPEEEWPASQRHEVCIEPTDQGNLVLLSPVKLPEGQILRVGTIICGCDVHSDGPEFGHAPRIQVCRAAYARQSSQQQDFKEDLQGFRSLSRSAEWGSNMSDKTLEKVKKGREVQNSIQKSRSARCIPAASTLADRKPWRVSGPVVQRKTSKMYVPEILKGDELTKKVNGFTGLQVRPQDWESPVTGYVGRILRSKNAPSISTFTGPKHRAHNHNVAAKIGSKEMEATIRKDKSGLAMHAKYDKIFAR